MAATDLTAERLRHVLHYDRATGFFVWRVRTSNRIKVGSVAGAPHNAGYVQIYIDGENHLAHRLAWLYVHGTWPENQIDHRNGIRSDNRFDNLRDTTPAMNMENLRRASTRNKTCGLLGASWSKKDRVWTAHITIAGKSTYIGAFSTAEAAHEAYKVAKRINHDGCTI